MSYSEYPRFKIVGEDWYGNRVTITDRDKMQQVGVIAIANVRPEVGWWLTSGSDFYALVEGEYWGFDYPGLLLYLFRYSTQHILPGILVSNEVFQDVLQSLKNDPDLPPKGSYLSTERKPVILKEIDIRTI